MLGLLKYFTVLVRGHYIFAHRAGSLTQHYIHAKVNKSASDFFQDKALTQSLQHSDKVKVVHTAYDHSLNSFPIPMLWKMWSISLNLNLPALYKLRILIVIHSETFQKLRLLYTKTRVGRGRKRGKKGKSGKQGSKTYLTVLSKLSTRPFKTYCTNSKIKTT